MSTMPEYIGAKPQGGDIIETVLKTGKRLSVQVREVSAGKIHLASRGSANSVQALMKVAPSVQEKNYFSFDSPAWLERAYLMRQRLEAQISDSTTPAAFRARLGEELDCAERFIEIKEAQNKPVLKPRSPHVHPPGSPVRVGVGSGAGDTLAVNVRAMERRVADFFGPGSVCLSEERITPPRYPAFSSTSSLHVSPAGPDTGAIDMARMEALNRMEALRLEFAASYGVRPTRVDFRGGRDGGPLWDDLARFGSAMSQINWPDVKKYHETKSTTRIDSMAKIIDRRTIILGTDLANVTTLEGHLSLLRQLKERHAELTAVGVESEAIKHQLEQLQEAQALVAKAMDAQHRAGK